MPKGVTWIRDAVADICPEQDAVLTADGRRIGYDYLVVAPGIQVNWDAIPGLAEALGRDGVCSNYSYDSVDKTWEFIEGFRGGTAIFTQPATPIKCGGAPQKIAYLADDAFRRNGVHEQANVIFATAGAGIFAVEKYARTLRDVVARRGSTCASSTTSWRSGPTSARRCSSRSTRANGSRSTMTCCTPCRR
jgi:sulfide:quinone oxidoreductase